MSMALATPSFRYSRNCEVHCVYTRFNCTWYVCVCVCDCVRSPLVKVRALQLIRILAKGDKDTSEAVNDILAQVCRTRDPLPSTHMYRYPSLLCPVYLGGHEYRIGQECRACHLVRISFDHHGDSVRERSSCLGHKHTRSLPLEQRQERQVSWVKSH